MRRQALWRTDGLLQDFRNDLPAEQAVLLGAANLTASEPGLQFHGLTHSDFPLGDGLDADHAGVAVHPEGRFTIDR